MQLKKGLIILALMALGFILTACSDYEGLPVTYRNTDIVCSNEKSGEIHEINTNDIRIGTGWNRATVGVYLFYKDETPWWINPEDEFINCIYKQTGESFP